MVSEFFIGFVWMSTKLVLLTKELERWEVIDRNLNEVWSSLGTVHHISKWQSRHHLVLFKWFLFLSSHKLWNRWTMVKLIMIVKNQKFRNFESQRKAQRSKSGSKKEKAVPNEERKLSAFSQVSQFDSTMVCFDRFIDFPVTVRLPTVITDH